MVDRADEIAREKADALWLRWCANADASYDDLLNDIAAALRSYADQTIDEIAIRIGQRGRITADQLRGFKCQPVTAPTSTLPDDK